VCQDVLAFLKGQFLHDVIGPELSVRFWGLQGLGLGFRLHCCLQYQCLGEGEQCCRRCRCAVAVESCGLVSRKHAVKACQQLHLCICTCLCRRLPSS
jgi:hypothetical protein